MPTRFSVAVAAKPTYTLTVTVTERDTKAALDGVEIRARARSKRAPTRPAGPSSASRAATFSFSSGARRTSREPQPIRVGRDDSLELTMVHVPEEHPDARWVR